MQMFDFMFHLETPFVHERHEKHEQDRPQFYFVAFVFFVD
jgi:hypothetical protein